VYKPANGHTVRSKSGEFQKPTRGPLKMQKWQVFFQYWLAWVFLEKGP